MCAVPSRPSRDAVFSPRLAGFVLGAFRAQGGRSPSGSSVSSSANGTVPASELDLTDRERQVLTYMARGYTYKEVAAAVPERSHCRIPRQCRAAQTATGQPAGALPLGVSPQSGPVGEVTTARWAPAPSAQNSPLGHAVPGQSRLTGSGWAAYRAMSDPPFSVGEAESLRQRGFSGRGVAGR